MTEAEAAHREPEGGETYCEACTALLNDDIAASGSRGIAFAEFTPVRHAPGNHLYARISEREAAHREPDPIRGYSSDFDPTTEGTRLVGEFVFHDGHWWYAGRVEREAALAAEPIAASSRLDAYRADLIEKVRALRGAAVYGMPIGDAATITTDETLVRRDRVLALLEAEPLDPEGKR